MPVGNLVFVREPAVPPTTTVLVVEDHPIVRRGIQSLIAKALPGSELVEVRDGASSLAALSERAFRLVILDLNLPDRNGLDLLPELKSISPAPILVFTVYPEIPYAFLSIRAGADGYLSKDAAEEEVLAALKTVVNGGKYVSPRVASFLAAQASPSRSHPRPLTL